MMNQKINTSNVRSISPYFFNELSPKKNQEKIYQEWKNNLSLVVFTIAEKINGMVFELYLKECVEKIEKKRERASPLYLKICGYIPNDPDEKIKILNVKKIDVKNNDFECDYKLLS